MPYNQLTGYVPEEKAQTQEEFQECEIIEDTEEKEIKNHGTRTLGILSVAASVLGIIFVMLPWLGVFVGLFAVALAVFSRKKNGYFCTSAVVGIIIGAIAIASCAFFIIYNAMTEAGMFTDIVKELWK